ncbi:hypothetical protein [Streptomyces sp. NPDC057002]
MHVEPGAFRSSLFETGRAGASAVLGHLDQVRDEVVAWEKRSRNTAFDD